MQYVFNMKYRNLTAGNIGEFMRLSQEQVLDIDLLDRDIKLLSMWHGKPTDYFDSMNFAEINEHRKELYKLLTEYPNSRYEPVFKVKGYKFVCLPNINTIKVKHERSLQILNLNDSNLYDLLPYIVAIFSDQKKQWFKKQLTFDERVKLFKDHLPADIAIGIALFFCAASKAIEPHVLTYLESLSDKLMQEAEAAIKASETDGE